MIFCGLESCEGKILSNGHCSVCGKFYENTMCCGLSSCEGRILLNGRCSMCGRTLAEGVQAEKANSSSDNMKGTPSSSKFFGGNHHPWRRFFARSVDIWIGLLIGWLFLVLIKYDFNHLFPGSSTDVSKSVRFIAGCTLLMLWLPIDAIFLSTTGTTPAKFLFGISVKTVSGQNLSFSQALSREFQVFFQGLGLGIPFISLFTQIFSHRRLVRTGTTLWDTATGSIVSHKEWEAGRAIVCTFTVLSVLFLAGISNDYQKQHLKGAVVESVVGNRPGEPTSHIQTDDLNKQGDAYYDTKQYDKAIESYQQAIRIKPDHFKAWTGLGAAYLLIEQYANAIIAFQEAVRINPDHANTWKYLGVAYDLSSQFAKAIEAYQRATRIAPDDADAWNSLGTSCYKIERYSTAGEAFLQAIRINPNDAEVWWRLGFIYFLYGQTEDVMRVYSQLKILAPDKADEFNQVVKVVKP